MVSGVGIWLRRIFPDPFVPVLLATMVLASVLPVRGDGVGIANAISSLAVFLLFLLNGIRLPRDEVLHGIRNWKLQSAIYLTVFALMPIIGVVVSHSVGGWMPHLLVIGLLYLGILPSTVQSATVASSMAGGNVAAAVVAAALINLTGIVVAPVLFALLAGASGVTISPDMAMRIVGIVLVPFVIGQALQRWLRPHVMHHKHAAMLLDRAAIAIAVYVAFSAAVVGGLWTQMPLPALLSVGALALVWLVGGMLLVWVASRTLAGPLNMTPADRVTLLFSGTQKSIAVGAPLATLLFPGAAAGTVLLPVLIYHIGQLILAAWLAAPLQRWVTAQAAPATVFP